MNDIARLLGSCKPQKRKSLFFFFSTSCDQRCHKVGRSSNTVRPREACRTATALLSIPRSTVTACLKWGSEPRRTPLAKQIDVRRLRKNRESQPPFAGRLLELCTDLLPVALFSQTIRLTLIDGDQMEPTIENEVGHQVMLVKDAVDGVARSSNNHLQA